MEERLPVNSPQGHSRGHALTNLCRLYFSGIYLCILSNYLTINLSIYLYIFLSINSMKEVAEICYLRLNLILLAIEDRKYEGGEIYINPRLVKHEGRDQLQFSQVLGRRYLH